MTTSVEAERKTLRAFRPTSARAVHVSCDDCYLVVTLEDGRIVQVPLLWFPRLHAASPVERTECEIAGGGTSLHWAGLDEDLTVANLLAGADTEST
ncbi:DUF2442 domain-containing protein [bacterium]|nr:DUF2442 domain-containing protein [bacterium]